MGEIPLLSRRLQQGLHKRAVARSHECILNEIESTLRTPYKERPATLANFTMHLASPMGLLRHQVA